MSRGVAARARKRVRLARSAEGSSSPSVHSSVDPSSESDGDEEDVSAYGSDHEQSYRSANKSRIARQQQSTTHAPSVASAKLVKKKSRPSPPRHTGKAGQQVKILTPIAQNRVSHTYGHRRGASESLPQLQQLAETHAVPLTRRASSSSIFGKSVGKQSSKVSPQKRAFDVLTDADDKRSHRPALGHSRDKSLPNLPTVREGTSAGSGFRARVAGAMRDLLPSRSLKRKRGAPAPAYAAKPMASDANQPRRLLGMRRTRSSARIEECVRGVSELGLWQISRDGDAEMQMVDEEEDEDSANETDHAAEASDEGTELVDAGSDDEAQESQSEIDGAQPLVSLCSSSTDMC